MNKKDFKQLTGENPEDVLGNDWKNETEEFDPCDCQGCGEPLNNADGDYCFQCQVAKAESRL